MTRILTIISTLILSILNIYSQTVEILDIWTDYNTYKDDMKGMTIHTKFSVTGMKGRQLECIIGFYDEHKNNIKCDMSGFRTRSNHAHTWSYATPNYDSSTFTDFNNFMPYKALSFVEGKHKYYYKVFIRDNNNKVLAVSDYKAFYGTGAKKHTSPSPSPQESTTYRQDLPDGSYAEITNKPDGSSVYVHHSRCYSCKGTGKCTMCKGASQVVSGWGRYARVIPCTFCGLSGLCKYCNGKGESIMVNYYDPHTHTMDGYNPHTGQHFRSVEDENRHYHDDSSYSSTTSTSGKSVCNNCHGTGVDPFPWKDPSSNVGQGLPWCYTNHDGAKCPYCNEWAWHQHYKCPSCNH